MYRYVKERHDKNIGTARSFHNSRHAAVKLNTRSVITLGEYNAYRLSNRIVSVHALIACAIDSFLCVLWLNDASYTANVSDGAE